MNPSMDWRINHAITKSRILTGVLRSSEFLFGITGPLLKVVDDMLEWLSDHKEHMSHDARVAYLVKVTKMQDDIDFYLGIRDSLYEEGGRHE